MIKNPYELEYSFAFLFFVEKKDTVSGIIGNTHGVNRAKNLSLIHISEPTRPY